MVRRGGFPSARHVLPLVGKTRLPISAHEMQRTGRLEPRHGAHRGCNRRPVDVDQVPVASHPAPDEELAAIAGTPELAADMRAREPDTPAADPAEQGWRGRPDNPHVLAR